MKSKELNKHQSFISPSNKVTLTIGIIFGLLAFVAKLVYRPIVNRFDFHDYGINGFLPSFFTVLALCLIGASVWSKNPKTVMLFATIGQLIYELEQIITERTFDLKDLASIAVAFGIALLIYTQIERFRSTIKKLCGFHLTYTVKTDNF